MKKSWNFLSELLSNIIKKVLKKKKNNIIKSFLFIFFIFQKKNDILLEFVTKKGKKYTQFWENNNISKTIMKNTNNIKKT